MVSDVSGVKEVNLFYRIGSGAWTKQIMNGQGSNDYEASIPQQSGTNITIDYYLEAADMWLVSPGNTGTFPVGANQSGSYHSFICGSTGIHDIQPMTMFHFNNYHNNDILLINFFLPTAMKVKILLFDVMGRKVATILDKNIKQGKHSRTWNSTDQKNGKLASGLYFLKIEANPVKTANSARSYKRIERFVLFK